MSECFHANGYETVSDNAMTLYKCLDCDSIIGGSGGGKKPSYEELEADNASLREDCIRHLQTIRHLNNELDEYFMDRQILTHMMDETTLEDDE